MTTEPTTTAPSKTSKLKPCSCSLFEFGQYGPSGDAESFTSETTGCARQTNKLFAQGHDAKLVGYLVRAEIDGLEIRTNQGGLAVTFPGAVQAAASLSEALGRKAETMLGNAKKKAETKATREAEKAKAKAEKEAAATQARADRGKPSAADMGIVVEAPKTETPRPAEGKPARGRAKRTA